MAYGFYVVARETWDIIEECSFLSEAKAAYKQYEATDREEGTFEPDFYQILKAPKGRRTFTEDDDITVMNPKPIVVAHKTIRSGGRNTLLINITEECRQLGLEYNDHIRITIEEED